MALIRKIPPHLLEAVKSGSATVYGGIIKDSSNGRILGHLEQTGQVSQKLHLELLQVILFL